MELSLRNEEVSVADRQEAEFINDLVDKGIIDKNRISKADRYTIGELLIRNTEDIKMFGAQHEDGRPFEVSEKRLRKIETLLGSREPQPEGEIEQKIKDTRKILETLREKTGLPFVGAIVCGSRMDENKKVRENSDLDLEPVIDFGNENLKDTVQEGKWKKIIEEMDLPYEVSITRFYYYDSLTSEVDNTPGDYINVPFWGWNPEAFKYVGELKMGERLMGDDEATEYLKEIMKSEGMEQRRNNRIQVAEKEIERLQLKYSKV